MILALMAYWKSQRYCAADKHEGWYLTTKNRTKATGWDYKPLNVLFVLPYQILLKTKGCPNRQPLNVNRSVYTPTWYPSGFSTLERNSSTWDDVRFEIKTFWSFRIENSDKNGDLPVKIQRMCYLRKKEEGSIDFF